MKGSIKLITGFTILLLFSGCVSMGDFEQMKAEMVRLNIENTELKKEVSELKTRMTRMSSDLSTAIALKEGQLTLIAQTQDYIKELQVLKGRFEENSYNNEKRFKELNEKISELQAKLTQSIQVQQEQTKLQKEKKDPQEIYDSAHVDIQNKNFVSAREKLQEIVKKYPDFVWLPNVYFWIAETYYNEKKFEEAILAYEEFLRKYPKHEKAVGALLKEGMAFMELNDKKTAKVIFERVIEKYPQSKEAQIAQQKIGEILKSQNKTKSKTKTKK